MVEWRPLIIGTVFTLAIYTILSFSEQGGINALIAFLLGGFVVGVIIEAKINYIEKIKHSLIHGAVLGVIAGLITVVILVIELVVVGLASILGTSIIVSVLILLVADVIAALAGVILGNFTRAEYIKSIQS